MYKWFCLNWIIKKNYSYIIVDYIICVSRLGFLLIWFLQLVFLVVDDILCLVIFLQRVLLLVILYKESFVQ